MLKNVNNLHSEMDQMPFTSDQDRQKLLEYSETWRQIGETFTTLETLLAGRFAPALKAIGDAFLGTVKGVDAMSQHLNGLLDNMEAILMIGGGLLTVLGLLTGQFGIAALGAKLFAGGAVLTGLSHGTDMAHAFAPRADSNMGGATGSWGPVNNNVHVTVHAKTNADPREISAQIAEEISTLLLVTSQEKHYGIK
jgi:hypothetical protein